MPVIEIWDGPSVKLAELVDELPTDDLNWSILEMWATALDETTNVVDLEERAARSPKGLALSGEELRAFAARLRQLIDGIIVGSHGSLPDRSARDLRDCADVVIEAIDSTLWRVYARDPALLEPLRRRFSDVRDVVPEVAIAAAHELS